MISQTKLRVKAAYEKGYEVSERGVVTNHKGYPLKVALYGTQKYPSFGVTLDKKFYGLPTHWLAAYSFFGDALFDFPVVRHRDGNVLNLSKENIALGSYSENEYDKPEAVRIAAAKVARASQL